MRAYDVEYHQVGPSSRTVLYDIGANVGDGTTKAQFRAILQSLLAKLFRMALHRETRQMDGYELAVAGNEGVLNFV